MRTQEVKLPREYHILPESIDFIIPGFNRHYTPGDKTLALRKRDCVRWYNEFIECITDACGRQFLPVCRMSDGEFKFALGVQPPDLRLPWRQKLKLKVGAAKIRMLKGGDFEARTIGHYHSGRYSADERLKALKKYSEMVRRISEKGILALHLSYGRVSFQEHYHPALDRWMKENRIILTDDNYYPFYFVYAALTGPRRGEILKNRRVLVVNGAQGIRRQEIEKGIRGEGVSELLWCPISLTRSLFDRIDFQEFIGKVDLAVVGAGIGKPNILAQMEPLNVPCIDAGFVFETWANTKSRWKRPFCVPDEDFDPQKVEFYDFENEN